ncbi:MAG: signal peptidase I [Fimbriimonadaceae bacterium]
MKKKHAVTGFGITLLLILGISLFFYLNFQTVVVSGPSMEPTYINGQRLLACKAYGLVGGIKDGDIVVIKGEKKDDYFIKRVYKSADEIVDFANVPESWVITQGDYKVPPGHIFVLGDNRAKSEDSRIWGAVALNRVIGKIISR